MKTIKNTYYKKDRVTVDDTWYEGCTFDNCILVYSGGAFGHSNTKFNDCKVQLIGAATNTVQFLQTFEEYFPGFAKAFLTNEKATDPGAPIDLAHVELASDKEM